jgi:hypothetical protein
MGTGSIRTCGTLTMLPKNGNTKRDLHNRNPNLTGGIIGEILTFYNDRNEVFFNTLN